MTHQQFSSKGGKARKKALSKARRREIAIAAAKARWRAATKPAAGK